MPYKIVFSLLFLIVIIGCKTTNDTLKNKSAKIIKSGNLLYYRNIPADSFTRYIKPYLDSIGIKY
jgi:hypothetical protein